MVVPIAMADRPPDIYLIFFRNYAHRPTFCSR